MWICAKLLKLRIFTGKKNKNFKNQSYSCFHYDLEKIRFFFCPVNFLLTLAQTYVNVNIYKFIRTGGQEDRRTEGQDMRTIRTGETGGTGWDSEVQKRLPNTRSPHEANFKLIWRRRATFHK
jgi:hypothetical protein